MYFMFTAVFCNWVFWTSLMAFHILCLCCLQEFFLQGRFIFGPDVRSVFLTMFLIIAPVVTFCVFVARHLMNDFPDSWGISVMVVVVVFTVYVSILLPLLRHVFTIYHKKLIPNHYLAPIRTLFLCLLVCELTWLGDEFLLVLFFKEICISYKVHKWLNFFSSTRIWRCFFVPLVEILV